MNIAPNGKKRWTVWVNRPVEDAQGNIVEFQSAGYDITERKLAEQALQQANEDLESQLEKVNVLQEQLLEQAVRDVLTGLFNRRYLQETLDREIARAGREDYPISLIMLDLDHFKILNDTFGHKAGDLILQSVGQIFLSHTRRMDIACRFGGEEFVIIMPSLPLELGIKRAETLRQAVADIAIPYNGQTLHATLSAGVAVYPQHGQDAGALLHAADMALYMAKNAGRNRVMAFQENPGRLSTGSNGANPPHPETTYPSTSE